MFLVEVAAALDMSVFVFGRAVKYALECLRMEAPPPAPGAYVARVACSLPALAQPALQARPVPLHGSVSARVAAVRHRSFVFGVSGSGQQQVHEGLQSCMPLPWVLTPATFHIDFVDGLGGKN